MKYAFISEHGDEFSVVRMCCVLGVSRSGYYDWVHRPQSKRARGDEQLLTQIRQIHIRSRRAYGSVKTWRELRAQGIPCGKHRVARLRRQNGIQALRRRRFRLTIKNQHTAAPAPNLVQRRFSVSQANRIWVGDMTYIRTRGGFLFLAVLLDLFARKVVGWSMHDRPTLETVLGALDMALKQRRPQVGLVHHTDQGALYSASRYRERMQAHGIVPSMSALGYLTPVQFERQRVVA